MPSTPDRAPLIQQGVVDFIIASDRLRFQIEAALRPLGINLTQMSLLNHMARHPDKPATISNLTEVMSIHQPGITKAVSALVEKGFLQKSDAADDARIKLIHITEKGQGLLNEARRLSYPAVEAAFAGFTDTDLPAFTRHLKTMKATLSEL